MLTNVHHPGNIASGYQRCSDDPSTDVPTPSLDSILSKYQTTLIRLKTGFDLDTVGFVIEDLLDDWFIENEPLGKKYSVVEMSGKKLNLLDLDMSDRLGFILSLPTDIGQFEPRFTNEGGLMGYEWQQFGSSVSFSDLVINILPNEEFIPAENDIDIPDWDKRELFELNSSYLRIWKQRVLEVSKAAFKSEYGLDSSSLSFRFITDGICSGKDDCKKFVRNYLGTYVQDRFHIRSCGNGENWINTASETRGFGSPILAKYASRMCGDFNSEPDLLGGIPGGNMFIIDSIVFIGRDALVKLLTTGVTSSSYDQFSFVDSLERSILRSIFGTEYGKHLVWVGTEESWYRRSLSNSGWKYQPYFHIDLFFHPLGTSGKVENGMPVFTYLIADSIIGRLSGNSSSSVTDILDSLQQWTEATDSILQVELRNLGYEPNRISIPIPIVFEEYSGRIGFKECQAYSNGISTRTTSGSGRNGKTQFEYLLPVYSGTTDIDINKLKEMLENRGLKVDLVNTHNTAISSLHCQSKVLRRE